MQGVLSPEDARMGVQAGADGIIVSNHGGRQLDFAPASLDALPGIAAAVGKRVPVLMDGGVRRGTDIIKVGTQCSPCHAPSSSPVTHCPRTCDSRGQFECAVASVSSESLCAPV